MCESPGRHGRDGARWPLSFQMSQTGHRFWSHSMYRGPRDQPVRVFYSRTKLESEEIANEFLGEKVIGFDMEWPSEKNTAADAANIRLQHKIGLIQIACEEKIALFHIGLHSGSTAKDLLAPTLRKIIEDPAIAKCGVAVHSADFARLRQWFGLVPRGAFELSHLHNLISFGASNPSECTTRLRSLSEQVEQHLGLPLHKGKVRTSNWSQPLNKDQANYAATDAYAGFMLFCCMNAKRMDMDPIPPLPVYAETYGDTGQGKRPKRPLQLVPVLGHVKPTGVLDFYRVPGEAVEDRSDVSSAHNRPADDMEAPLSAEGVCGYVRIGRRGKHILSSQASDTGADVMQKLREQHNVEQRRREGAPSGAPPPAMTATNSTSLKVKKSGPAVGPGLIDENKTKRLFEDLRSHRRDLANERKCPPFLIARDTQLQAIARVCPRSDVELLRIHGIGKKKLADYGSAWLAIVKDFVDRSGIGDASRAKEGSQQLPSAVPANSHPGMRASHVQLDRPKESAPTLPTGISFRMQNASLGRGKDGEENKIEDDLGDQKAPHDDSAIGSPLREPSPSVLKRKREVDMGHEPDSVRRVQSQRRCQAEANNGANDGKLCAQAAVERPPHILSSVDRRSSDDATAVTQTPHTNYEGTLAAQQGASASLAPLCAPENVHPHHRPFARPEESLQSATRPSSAGKIQDTVLRNRIVAFNRFVTTAVQLPTNTIEHLVSVKPRTMEELLQVPGIMPFANACSRANHDLLGFLVKPAITR